MAQASVQRLPQVHIGPAMPASPVELNGGPESRRGLVSRTRLVGRLMAAREVPLVVLVAPAGYGKTTLVAEWATRDDRPFAWVALGAAHNDPDNVTRATTTALRKASARGDDRDRVVLVFDGVDALTSPAAIDILSRVIEQRVCGSQVVLTSRTEPALGLGALRAKRKLLELRAADLAMDPCEAAVLVGAHGFNLDRADLDLLVQRTEGWPVGLYLAALAARGEPRPARALADFTGDDRFVTDYIGDELLAELPADEIAFLRRTSVLESLSGPLCNFVLERADSARMLKDLSRTNLMLVPLDRGDTEYRYHRLFAQALRGELSRSEPDAAGALHRRASDWYEEHDEVERSIEHAIAAGDTALAGERLWSHAVHLLGYGKAAELSGWLDRFSETQVAASSKLALAAAASGLFAADRTLVEHWTSAALHGPGGDDSSPGRPALEAQIHLLRAAVAEQSVSRMGAKAEAACAELPEDAPWLALGQLLQGVASHLTGERTAARGLLEDGARHAAVACPGIQALCLAQLCMLSIERGDWTGAGSLAGHAKAQIERSGLQDYPTSALVYAVSAEVQAHLGRVETSQADAREASSLLEKVHDFAAWYEAETRIALARAAVRLSDVPSARALLAEAIARLERTPDAQVALGWIDACQAQADLSASSSAVRDWCLTTAELRVLQFLPTHLSIPEIAERLYVSANTVKTHARSVYRKLAASSRGEAVTAAREAGLLDETSHTGIGPAPLTDIG
jgi:LuxR family transcriptional regulator, maltose regulon positive regulatory protein